MDQCAECRLQRRRDRKEAEMEGAEGKPKEGAKDAKGTGDAKDTKDAKDAKDIKDAKKRVVVVGVDGSQSADFAVDCELPTFSLLSPLSLNERL